MCVIAQSESASFTYSLMTAICCKLCGLVKHKCAQSCVLVYYCKKHIVLLARLPFPYLFMVKVEAKVCLGSVYASVQHDIGKKY